LCLPSVFPVEYTPVFLGFPAMRACNSITSMKASYILPLTTVTVVICKLLSAMLLSTLLLVCFTCSFVRDVEERKVMIVCPHVTLGSDRPRVPCVPIEAPLGPQVGPNDPRK